MWLPKDERHLLLGYYVNMFNIDDRNVCRYLDKPKWFEMSDWTDVLKKPRWIPILTPWLVKHRARRIKAYGDTKKASNKEDESAVLSKKEVKTCINLKKRLQISNAALERRKLIKVQRHEHVPGVSGITLTDGYDLGRKYSSALGTAWVWCNEYKFWVILALIISLIGVLVAIFKD